MNTIFQKLVFMLVIVLVACTSQVSPTLIPTQIPESVSIKLAWMHSVQFLGYYIADVKNFYADEGLSINIESLADISEYSTIREQVVDGEFDFSMGANLSLMNEQADGTRITIISSISQRDPATFFARANTGIVTPSDLKGRTIAVKGEAWQLLLGKLLETANLTLDDVVMVDVGFDMTPFYEEEVEVWAGYITDEVVHARIDGLELVTFPLYEYAIDDTAEVIYTSQALLETRPDVAIGFLRATLRGWQWAVENPTEAVDLMLEHFPEMADERDFHLASFNALIPLVRLPGVPIGSIDCERWLNDARFEALDSTENLCTTEVFEQAINES